MDEKKKLKVVVLLRASQAKEVFLLGDFNNWDPKTPPMKKNGRGLWKTSMLLTPGRYEYKLLVDGQWRLDRNNPNRALNSLGTENNVLMIPEK
jgi:1,4-alpha-glucan branching enzyme